MTKTKAKVKKEPEARPERPELDALSPEGQEALRNLIVTLEGGNPRAQSLLIDFMQMRSNVERTFLPTRRDVQQVDYANYAAKTFWPDHPNNPFADCRDSICESWMPYKGEKSRQTVELFRQTPNLSDLQTVSDNRSMIDKLLGRERAEE